MGRSDPINPQFLKLGETGVSYMCLCEFFVLIRQRCLIVSQDTQNQSILQFSGLCSFPPIYNSRKKKVSYHFSGCLRQTLHICGTLFLSGRVLNRTVNDIGNIDDNLPRIYQAVVNVSLQIHLIFSHNITAHPF